MRTIGIFIGIIGAAIGASGFGLFWWAHTTILQGNMNSGLHWLSHEYERECRFTIPRLGDCGNYIWGRSFGLRFDSSF